MAQALPCFLVFLYLFWFLQLSSSKRHYPPGPGLALWCPRFRDEQDVLDPPKTRSPKPILLLEVDDKQPPWWEKHTPGLGPPEALGAAAGGECVQEGLPSGQGRHSDPCSGEKPGLSRSHGKSHQNQAGGSRWPLLLFINQPHRHQEGAGW